jgi:hypothetical protein
MLVHLTGVKSLQNWEQMNGLTHCRIQPHPNAKMGFVAEK